MLNVNISQHNADNVRHIVTTEPAPTKSGYDFAIYATMNGHRYKLETLKDTCNIYALTFEDPATGNVYHLHLDAVTAQSIRIYRATIYKRGCNIQTRCEESPRLLKKYSQLAAMVHGLIINGDNEPKADPETTTHGEAEDAHEEPTRDTAHTTARKDAPRLFYRVTLYDIDGATRADIRTSSGRPWLDIPAADLDAIRAEIAQKDTARVRFEVYDATQGKPVPTL